jgi:hypothetical protein
MSRYLIDPFIRSAISRGRSVEQFLGGFSYQGDPAIRWLSIRADDNGVVLSLYESYDPQEEDFVDVYSFPELEVEQGEAAAEHTCESIEEALALARSTYGASADRWVNDGVVQDEYGDYRKRQ